VPLPTIAGRGPLAGANGCGGAVVHGPSRHSVPGYEDLKHPVFGRGARDRAARQAARLCADGGGGLVFSGAGPVVLAIASKSG